MSVVLTNREARALAALIRGERLGPTARRAAEAARRKLAKAER